MVEEVASATPRYQSLDLLLYAHPTSVGFTGCCNLAVTSELLLLAVMKVEGKMLLLVASQPACRSCLVVHRCGWLPVSPLQLPVESALLIVSTQSMLSPLCHPPPHSPTELQLWELW